MVAYNFQSRFADRVKWGTKRQTVRKPRKNGHAKIGDDLQLYMGLRQPKPLLLREAVCTNVREIVIDLKNETVTIGGGLPLETERELTRFARRDGFKSWQEMRAWFVETHGMETPFRGFLIEWKV